MRTKASRKNAMHAVLTTCVLAGGMSGCVDPAGDPGPPPAADDLDPQAKVLPDVQNLVLAMADEEYRPALNLTPRGDAVYNWKHWYFDPNATPPHPSTKALGELQGHMVADSGEHLLNISSYSIYVSEMMEYWADNRVGEFLIDSDEAAVIAFDLGGNAASIGRDLVKIHYRLHAVDGAPRWDVVYREGGPGGGLPFFAVSLDAKLGTLVKMSTSWPEIEMSEAMSLADADAWASDAILLKVQGNEGMWSAIVAPETPTQYSWALPSGAEMVPGDNRSTSWMLDYYSPSLETSRSYVTLGGQLLFAHDWNLSGPMMMSVQLEAERRANMTRSYSDVGDALVAFFGTNQTDWGSLRYALGTWRIAESDPPEWTWAWGIEPQSAGTHKSPIYLIVDAHNQTIRHQPQF